MSALPSMIAGFSIAPALVSEPGANQASGPVSQAEVSSDEMQPKRRMPNEALLNLTCKDIEAIIYARLNWPR